MAHIKLLERFWRKRGVWWMRRYRHEYKYIIDETQEIILYTLAQGILQRDSHVEADGMYTIRSLYFDDPYDSCFYENMNGTDPRSKFRIRYYNHDLTQIRLEKKSKMRGMTHKVACSLTMEECLQLMQGQYILPTEQMPQEKTELLLEMQMRLLQPKVIVTYDRIPFVYAGGNVRVTFDKNIAASNEISSFLNGEYRQRPIMAYSQSILEIKWDELLPLHIQEILQLDTLRWSTFSKYYMCRNYNL